jgi:hypothetical protein
MKRRLIIKQRLIAQRRACASRTATREDCRTVRHASRAYCSGGSRVGITIVEAEFGNNPALEQDE